MGSLVDGVLYAAINKASFGIAGLISWIVGVSIAVVSWFVQVMLELSRNVGSSALVKFGYPVTLTFANLCFLVAIIVIAIMTILRQDSYGVKKALWRLAVIAIMVNFGLVIAKSLLDISDQFAMFFLNAIDPSNQGYGNFAAALGGAFAPQKAFISDFGSQISNVQSNVSAGTWGSFLAPITALLYSILAGIGIVVSLAALVVMLTIRYVYLGYLLVMLPIAWASWIFPATKKHWSKWWDNFIKWTFFSPILLFFLWLVIMVSKAMSSGDGFNFDALKEPTGPAGTVARAAFGFIGPLAQNLLQTAVLVSLLLAGLGAAHGLGVSFSDTAQGFVKGTFKGVGTWAQRRTRSGANWASNKILQQDKEKGRLDRWREKLAGSNWAARYTAGYAVQGLQKGVRYVGKDVVKEYDKEVGGKDTKELQALLINANAVKSIAIQKELLKRNEIAGIKPEKVLTKENKDFWARNGQSIGDMEKAFMRSVEAQEAIARSLAGVPGAEKEAFEELQKFWKKMKKDDAKKMQADTVFGFKKEGEAGYKGEVDAPARRIALLISQAMAATNGYQLIPSIVAKTKGATQENIKDVYPDGINEAAASGRISMKDAVDLHGHFEKVIANNALGGAHEEHGDEHAAPAAAPAGGGGGAAGGGAPNAH